MATRHSGRGGSGESGGWGGQLISLSDLMAGLLFIFILIVLVFAFELNRATRAQKAVVNEMTNTLSVREQLLRVIDEELQKEGLRVKVNYENGVLSLPEGILFPSGSADLRPEGMVALEKLSKILSRVLPCYTGSPDDPLPPGCTSPANRGKLEAVFLEGHTDTVRVSAGAKFHSNWDLSAARSITVFEQMMLHSPDLDGLTNAAGQPLFSVSGYADRRPYGGDRMSNLTEEGRARNRRIDVRFIMTYPKKPDIVREMENRWGGGAGN